MITIRELVDLVLVFVLDAVDTQINLKDKLNLKHFNSSVELERNLQH